MNEKTVAEVLVDLALLDKNPRPEQVRKTLQLFAKLLRRNDLPKTGREWPLRIEYRHVRVTRDPYVSDFDVSRVGEIDDFDEDGSFATGKKAREVDSDANAARSG